MNKKEFISGVFLSSAALISLDVAKWGNIEKLYFGTSLEKAFQISDVKGVPTRIIHIAECFERFSGGRTCVFIDSMQKALSQEDVDLLAKGQEEYHRIEDNSVTKREP